MGDKIRSILKRNQYIVGTYDKSKVIRYKYLISDKKFIKKKFKSRLNREVELDNPVKFNDKLQWLKLKWNDPLATKCADKYEVREFISEKIGSEYLNELYGVYESVDDIDIKKLPDRFVFKGTHGSGFNTICNNKYEMNWENEFQKMKRWLKTNYFWQNREWVYKDIKPRIICEKYLEEVETGELRDYKIFCFDGEPKIIEVDFARFKNHKRNFYDLNWKQIKGEIKYQKDESVKIQRPQKLNEMLMLSKKLSQGFPHVRVDFYYINDKVIFGELTFFHESGMGMFRPEEFEIQMGNWLELPILK
ncbi:ATP-grasp fold amidoligase family protein [Vallitalea sediminicola]